MYMPMLKYCLLFLCPVGYSLAMGEITTPEWQDRCPDEQCVVLRDCAFFLRLLRLRQVNERKLVLHNICGTDGYRIKVCCPDIGSAGSTLGKLPTICGDPWFNSRNVGMIGTRTSPGEFPWLVAFGYIDHMSEIPKFLCSGSLINDRYVLTAAHCLHSVNLGGIELSEIRIGDWNLSRPTDCVTESWGMYCAPPYIKSQPKEVIFHPLYNPKTYENDIALVALDQKINLRDQRGFISPICLPHLGLNPEFASGRSSAIGIGWGKMASGEARETPFQVRLPFVDRNICKRLFGSKFGGNQLCLSKAMENYSCGGDSGGPLMLSGPDHKSFLQIGIASHGSDPCGTDGYPTLYTSVSYYVDWIEGNIYE